jgi:hypothetical protein
VIEETRQKKKMFWLPTCKTRHEIAKSAALLATESRPGVPVGVLYREDTMPWQLDFAGTSWAM